MRWRPRTSPGEHAPADAGDDAVVPRPGSRIGERIAARAFRGATRVTGLRPSLVPAYLRRQLQLIGVDDEQLARVLGNLRSLADWPYAWEAEGDRKAAAGDWLGATASYYVGQRLLLTPSPLKSRLYALVRDAYERAALPGLEHFRTATPANDVAGLLEIPQRAQPAGGHPLVLMIPGVTATKEEMHVFAAPVVARGYAVARIDNPGYGETSGVMDVSSIRNGTHVLEQLARDPRIDASRMHVLGTSLGGACALHCSYDSLAASTTVIAAPFSAWKFLADLPPSNITALHHMCGTKTFEELFRVIRSFDVAPHAAGITLPLRIFHGGRDRTVPVGEATLTADAVAGPAAVTIWERDHHNCLEHFDDIIAGTLEWMHDPAPAIREYARERAEQARAARGEAAAGQAGSAAHLGDEGAEPATA